MRPIEGYTAKKYSGIRLVVRDDLVSLYSAREWQDFCASFFHKRPPGQLCKQTSTKEIFTLPFPPHEPGVTCLVKKYKNTGLAGILKNAMRGSRALHEFRIACAINGRGIPAAVPLFAAERVQGGFVRESLLALPFLSGACELKEFFLDPQNVCRRACTAAERRSIISSFGRLTATIFQSGIYQNDYSLNNFLIRKEGDSHRIYFIDCERAAITAHIADQKKTELLAKLNRAGQEVSVKDRLRFLRGYLEINNRAHDLLSPSARKLQTATLAMIQRDLRRGRLTSVYTSGEYKKFRTPAFRGMYKSGYRLEEILNRLVVLPREERQATVTMNCGADLLSLIVVRMARGNAERTWASINALKLAGLPLEMPHIYAEGDTSGFLVLKIPESGVFPDPEAISRQAGPGTMKVIETHFPEERNKIFSLYRILTHQAG
jgi:tRNA A-37 threonylcarbamoyl transferase component Bud32